MSRPLSYWNSRTVRELERDSIRGYLEGAARNGYVAGATLDYGCGRQPYRDVVENAGATYVGYDRDVYPGAVAPGRQGPDDPWAPTGAWRTIICTQVVQYVVDVEELLWRFVDGLAAGGHLVITWPTCWDEVEPTDLHRFTRAGMLRMLTEVGFALEHCERRAEIELGGFRFPLGYGAVARRPA